MCDKFIEFLFQTLNQDDNFHSIFSSEHLSYDIIYHSTQINNSAFGFKFSNFKQLLIENHDKPYQEQGLFFNSFFENWISYFNNKQLDDVMLLGFKVMRE